MTLSIGNSELMLTRAEHAVLSLFLDHPDTVFSRTELLERCWTRADKVSPQTINTFICRMRKKLGDEGPQITTVRSVGYRLSIEHGIDRVVADGSWLARHLPSSKAA